MELNGVFYRTPTPKSVRRWRDETGRHFVFAWKASKFITHWKRLTENSINSLQLLDERLSILGDKAGPILFQLPPDFAADAGRLSSFLHFFLSAANTALNSAIPVGMRRKFFACWRIET